MTQHSGFGPDELDTIVGLVRADTARLSIPPAELSVFDGRSGASSPDGVEIEYPTDDADAVFATYGNHWFRVTLDKYSDATVSIFSIVQDDVMGELGRGWPELNTNGEFGGILEPRLSADGMPVWAIGEQTICNLGELDSAVGDRIVW